MISVTSKEDIKKLYASLGLVRSLLMVQVDSDEEELLKQSIWSGTDANFVKLNLLSNP